ncbi:homoserine kinase [Marinigracilibium pacificum]|uniref:Homoserine kinase n=1 Tax=Marinigracilibium pacificum TaxID=2729599 RepID=A0A848J592_9BACT|nr:homoserine kinase [Marinigracilibium pacificum]NMM50645.1 homoserine kinase [Marinigracilibium pacificum]
MEKLKVKSDYKKVTAFAPATVANVSCGFDILGFALSNPGDEVSLERVDDGQRNIRIKEITGDNGRLPTEVLENTAGIAVQQYIEQAGITDSVEIMLKKQMPLGSGMGSSAASAVAAVAACEALFQAGMPLIDQLKIAMEGERKACGSAHADNVAPALYGGFTLIRSYQPLDVVRLPVPDDLYCVLIHPDVEVRTQSAREILRQKVSLSDAVIQTGNVAGLISSLYTGDYELLSRSLQDVLVEPIRKILIPAFDKMKYTALKNGAIGYGISGSGPAMFALCKGEEMANNIKLPIKEVLEDIGVEGKIYVSPVNQQGPVIKKLEQ